MSKSKLQVTINGKTQLTKSKQFLADAIHASGKGWPDGANWSCQHKRMKRVVFTRSAIKPHVLIEHNGWSVDGDCFFSGFKHDKLSPNWHQAVLSREEYFSAYPEPKTISSDSAVLTLTIDGVEREITPYPAGPAADADGWIEWEGGDAPVGFGTLVDVRLRGNGVVNGQSFTSSDSWAHNGGALDIIAYRLHKPAPAEKLSPEAVVNAKVALIGESIEDCVRKPTIEQLAADYCARNDFAGRLQQYADEAKADAEAKLAELVEAGKALGIDVSPITEKKEPELAITNWRDLRVGDEVECLLVNTYGADYADNRIGSVGRVIATEEPGRSGQSVKVEFDSGECYWIAGWRFIRRP